MKRLPLTLTSLALLAGVGFGQSQEIYSIPRPAGANLSWGESLNLLDDLNGDGVPEVLIGGVEHGGGAVATVHSGADGAYLYPITVPHVALFYGDGFTPLSDRNGDGIPDIMVIGSRSGDSHSYEGELRIHSGADGSTLQVFLPPTNVNFMSRAEFHVQNMGDMDGDGSDDILCRTYGTAVGGTTYSLFSSATGQVIYHVTPVPNTSTFDGVAVLADHDGDGFKDFALARRAGTNAYLVIVSGATGGVISQFNVPELLVLTGNREPFIALRNEMGKGASHVAFGGVFSGAMGRVSTLDGSIDWHFTCNQNTETCFGSRLIDVGDVNNDGHADLWALESRFTSNSTLGLQLIDGFTGEVLDEEVADGIATGYSVGDRIQGMPGLDPLGFPSFAQANESGLSVSIRRLVPEIGMAYCAATDNSSGLGATLRAQGSASVSAGNLKLHLEQAPAGTFAVFIQGDAMSRTPFGDGLLCVAGSGSRMGFGFVDAGGRMSLDVDLAVSSFSPIHWTAQVLFRDTTPMGLNSSSAVALELLP
ncbi:MAG: hypothetical protein KDB61_04730 [Planctomycetes bacterium]|nr:hypothetical protein [Planctomycetota bacterium]